VDRIVNCPMLPRAANWAETSTHRDTRGPGVRRESTFCSGPGISSGKPRNRLPKGEANFFLLAFGTLKPEEKPSVPQKKRSFPEQPSYTKTRIRICQFRTMGTTQARTSGNRFREMSLLPYEKGPWTTSAKWPKHKRRTHYSGPSRPDWLRSITSCATIQEANPALRQSQPPDLQAIQSIDLCGASELEQRIWRVSPNGPLGRFVSV